MPTDKDRKKGAGRPAGRTPTTTIFARVPPALAELLEAYLDDLRPRPTTTSVMIAALEDFLAARGYKLPRGKEGGGK